MEATVVWVLSRVGPTIRRGLIFVSDSTTAFMCTTRLRAIVVSLKHDAGPGLLFVSAKKV